MPKNIFQFHLTAKLQVLRVEKIEKCQTLLAPWGTLTLRRISRLDRSQNRENTMCKLFFDILFGAFFLIFFWFVFLAGIFVVRGSSGGAPDRFWELRSRPGPHFPPFLVHFGSIFGNFPVISQDSAGRRAGPDSPPFLLHFRSTWSQFSGHFAGLCRDGAGVRSHPPVRILRNQNLGYGDVAKRFKLY